MLRWTQPVSWTFRNFNFPVILRIPGTNPADRLLATDTHFRTWGVGRRIFPAALAAEAMMPGILVQRPQAEQHRSQRG